MTGRWLLAGLALTLAACAHRGPVEVDDGLGFDERQRQLAAIPAWQLEAQLIIDTGERRERVRVDWEQREDTLSLTVRGIAIGAGSFRIAGDAGQLVIEGRGETRVLDDPERELSNELGWWLPVTSLEHWLLGSADGDYPERMRLRLEAPGTIASLAQRDWNIEYEEYQLADGLLVPRRLTMTNAPLELRLTITEFSSLSARP